MDDEAVLLSFTADVAEAAASMDELRDTTVELAGAAEEAQAGLDSLRDSSAEAAAGLDESAASSTAAAAAADDLAESLGHLRDEAIEAAAALQGVSDAEGEAAASGAAAEGMAISPMVAGMVALVGAIAAVAPAIAAVGLGFGAAAVFAIPVIKQITGALGDTKAQLDKLPVPIRDAVDAVKSLEGQWQTWSKFFQPETLSAFYTALQIAGSVMQQVLPLASQGFFAINQALMDIRDAVKSTGFSTFIQDMTKLVMPATNAMMQLAGTIFGILGNALEQLAPMAVPFINMLNNLLKAAGPALTGALKFIGTTIMDIGKAITPVLGPLGKFFDYLNDHPVFAQIAAGIIGVVAALKAFSVIMGIVDAVMDADPFVLLAVALAGLAILIATHTHQIAEAFDVVRHTVASWGHDIASAFDQVRHDVASWGHDVANTFDTVRHDVAHFTDDVLHPIEAAFNWIKNNWKLVLAWLVDPIGMAVFEIRTHTHQISQAFDQLRHDIASILDSIRHGIATAWDNVRHDTAAILDGARHDIASTWDNIRHDIAATVDAIPGAIVKAWDTVRHDAAAAFDDVLHTIENAWHSITSTTSTGASQVEGFFERLPGDILKFLENLPSNMLKIGQDIINGLLHGIEAAASGVLNYVKGLAGDIESYFTDPLKIFSPSKVFYEHGWNIIQGAIDGVKANAPNLLAAVRGAGAGIASAGVGAAALGPAGSSTTHVTVPVQIQGGTPGALSPQYQQGLQAAVQEAVLRYNRVNPGNGLNVGWGRG